MSKKVIFVSGPYTGETVFDEIRNTAYALKQANKLWHKGWVPICPHGNSVLMEGEWEMFIAGCIELIRRSDAIVMIGDWKNSRGSLIELNMARKLNKPVYFGVDEVPYVGE